MATFVSKQLSVKAGLYEYTVTGTIALPSDYLEMVFDKQVHISQIYWKWTISAWWRLWIVDSQGLMVLLEEVASPSSYQNEYVMNWLPSSSPKPPRYFDVPVGGRLRLEVHPTDSSGGGVSVLSCVADSF